jgi:hypothetical protein
MPYDGMQLGPVRIERFGRHIRTSVDTSSPDFEAFRIAAREAVAELPGIYDSRLQALKDLLADYDAFDALAAVWMTNAVADPETYKEWQHPGVQAACELLATALVQRGARRGARPDRMLVGSIVEETQSILLELLNMKAFLLMVESTDSGEDPDPFSEVRAPARSHRLVVRGPSYDWQEEQTVRELFGHETVADDVLTACGFTADTALRLVDGVVEIGLDRLRERANQARAFAEELLADVREVRDGHEPRDVRSRTVAEALTDLSLQEAEERIHTDLIAWTSVALGTTMSFTAAELAAHVRCDADEVASYLETFSVRFGESSESGREIDVEDIRERPIVADGAGSFLCVSLPSLLWALRPRIERTLNAHDSKAFARYERHRSKMVEHRAVSAVKKALKPDWAYEALSYEVEEDGVIKRPEVDGLVRADTALLIIESKASSMRPSARRLAPDSFRDWLGKEVSRGAKQARRSRAALVDSSNPPALVDESGRAVTAEFEGIHHVFELVVVLEDLPGIAPSSWQLSDAGVLPRDPIPWLVSLHDLELICEVVERPSELVHYLLRRRRMDETRRAWAPDELDYFMHYLLRGLYWPEETAGETSVPEQLLSHTEELDSWFMYQRGQRKTPAKRPTQKHHSDVAGLLDCIDKSGADGRLDAALAILDIDGKPRRQIASFLRELKHRSELDGHEHDASLIATEHLGLTVMTCPPAASHELGHKLRSYCGLKKHQMKCDRWVGFGGWSGPREPAQLVVVFNEPWKPDDELDRLVATLPSAGVEGNFDGRLEARRRRRQRRRDDGKRTADASGSARLR